MDLPSSFSINYGDFYKFLISAGIIVFVASSLALFFLIQNYNIFNNYLVYFFTFYMYVAFAIASLVAALWGCRKWYKNQKKLDIKLDAEVNIKLLEMRLKAASYEKEIGKLAKKETIGDPFEVFEKVKRKRVSEKVESHLKGRD